MTVILGMGAGIRWGLDLASAIIVAYGVLLLYTQFVNESGFATILTVLAAIALAGAGVMALRAIFGARRVERPPRAL